MIFGDIWADKHMGDITGTPSILYILSGLYLCLDVSESVYRLRSRFCSSGTVCVNFRQSPVSDWAVNSHGKAKEKQTHTFSHSFFGGFLFSIQRFGF